MPLRDDLEAVHRGFHNKAPELASEFDADTARLVDAKVGGDGPAVGAAAPAFELPDQLGRAIRSTDLLANGPLVINFYRGHW